MGASYHQFCPVAKAMELLDERWTLLLVRELMSGSEHFNDLRRGLPRMSPTLLSKRLQQLARAGVVDRFADGDDVRYVLSPAGAELRPVVEALGAWGVRWIGEIGEQDLDPSCCCGTCIATSTGPPRQRAAPSSSSGSPTYQRQPAIGGW
ncbi:MAG TPA: helix-turn-helix domain-containing protein [Micromonosporaceae bacterium]|jgi:DNA-binding HxlR family transcriptional regulator|nr:helix-turn-helix domain-containing protein [Micromonosporaceae bacterium]